MKKSAMVKSLAAAGLTAAGLLATSGVAYAGPYSATMRCVSGGANEVVITADVETNQMGQGWTWDAFLNGVLVVDNAQPGTTQVIPIGSATTASIVIEFITPEGYSDGKKPPIDLTDCTVTDTTVPPTAPDTAPDTTLPGQSTTSIAGTTTTAASSGAIPATTRPPSVASGTQLPATGTDAGIPAIVGALAIAGGVALLIVRRRPATD